MKTLCLLLTLSSCTTMYRVVQPVEAIQLCGKPGVKDYSALSGVVTCNKGMK